jgi:hemerythrin
MAMTWTSQYATSVPEIDEHHQTIITQLNTLHDQMKQGKGKQEIISTLEFLTTYTKMHFAAEEKLMQTYNCPVAELNKQQHAEFLQKVVNFGTRFDNEGASPTLTLAIQHELTDWILNHILKIDQQLKSCVQ